MTELPVRRQAFGMVTLRMGVGLVWVMNFAYVVAPANQYFATFAATASAMGPTTLGGPGLATFAAGHDMAFAVLVGGVTGYLAVAFLLGISTRIACVVGLAFSSVLIVAQFGSLVNFPGVTDVGPQPLYFAIYGAMLVGRAEGVGSLDAWIRSRKRGAPAGARHASIG